METPVSGKIETSTKCIKTIYIIAAAIPVILAIILWLAKPSFVMKAREDTNEMVVHWASLGKWVLIVTLLAWLGLFLYQNYMGASKSSVCVSVSRESAAKVSPEVTEVAVADE